MEHKTTDLGNGYELDRVCPQKTVMWDLFYGSKYVGTFPTKKAAIAAMHLHIKLRVAA